MNVHDLITTLQEASRAISSESIGEEARAELRRTCESLSSSLETPLERLVKTSSGCIELSFMRVAIDTGIFDLLNNDIHENAKWDVSEIARSTGVDPSLTLRILRFLLGLRMIDLTPEKKCKANRFTRCMVPGNYYHDYVIQTTGLYAPTFAQLPEYLRQSKYHAPAKANSGVFQSAVSKDKHFFEYLETHQPEKDAFHRIMEATQSSHLADWTQYISEERLHTLVPYTSKSPNSSMCQDKDEEKFTIVDIAGGHGHELKSFMQRFPDLQGRFVLQDLPGVSSPQPAIETIGHNFFDAQPVHGANIYLLARILHDWPDSEARQILRRTRDAMHNGSVLFVYECVLPDGLWQASLTDVIHDAVMMSFFGSLERSERDFVQLFRSVGLRLVKVWRKANASDEQLAVLEIMREN